MTLVGMAGFDCWPTGKTMAKQVFVSSGDPLPFVFNDGGRAAAGWKGWAGDCVVRAVAIATCQPYQDVYDAINVTAQAERPRRGRSRSSARNGVHRRTLARYLVERGWYWTPTMQIGSGTTVHLRQGELPMGRLIVSCSRHMVAVVDGVVRDLSDPCRGGTRCVYGYWRAP